MPTFDELKQRYMLVGGPARTGGTGSSLSGSGGASPPPSIPVYTDSLVVPLTHGQPYFSTVKAKINELGTGDTSGQFIYIAGWWLHPDFSLDGVTGTKLTDLLIQKAHAGVDVRVLGWVMAPEVMQNSRVQSSREAAGILGLNGSTMQLINTLRTEPALADKACLNILSHPAGAVHRKMMLIGTSSEAFGFTGGLDCEPDRHQPWWHDVQAQVTGPAFQGVFEAFREMWNEVRRRSPVSLTAAGTTCTSHSRSMPDLPARPAPSATSSRMHVQSARTVSAFNFSTLASAAFPTNSPMSFAPSGVFEIKRVWQKGISGAQRYIYIEDQAFTSGEVFDWINRAVKDNPLLRVILVKGFADPKDPPNSVLEKFLRVAINNHLLKGLSSTQINRIGYFGTKAAFIHAKTTIVDDQWALIGSANCMRRSLYTDFEHAVSFMDEAGSAVPAYREELWGRHFSSSTPDLSAALDNWFALPFQGSGTTSHVPIERYRLPLPSVTVSDQDQVFYDEIHDVDSREAWGGDLAAHYITTYGAEVLSL